MIAALSGFVHDRERTAYYERDDDDDNDSYYGSVHCDLPCEPLCRASSAQGPIGVAWTYASGFNWFRVV